MILCGFVVNKSNELSYSLTTCAQAGEKFRLIHIKFAILLTDDYERSTLSAVSLGIALIPVAFAPARGTFSSILSHHPS